MWLCVKAAWKTHVIGHEVSVEPCSAVLWCLVVTEGSPQGEICWGVCTNLPISRGTQRPCGGSGQKWVNHVDQTFLSLSPFPGLFGHFVTVWEIRTTNQTTESVRSQTFKGLAILCTFLLLTADKSKLPSLVARWSSSSNYLLWLASSIVVRNILMTVHSHAGDRCFPW